jgi:hypothetical protein
MTLWYIVLIALGDHGLPHGTIMQQPFASRAECEKSAAFLTEQRPTFLEGAYCIPKTQAPQ